LVGVFELIAILSKKLTPLIIHSDRDGEAAVRGFSLTAFGDLTISDGVSRREAT
jgi:hypothetical protein